MNKTKKIIALMAMTFAMATVSNGQIFETEDGASHRYGTEVYDPDAVIPLNGQYIDQTNEVYTPLGDGIMLLAALGGSYLLGKRNKKEKKNNNK